MTDSERKFLEENFKAGQYSQVTILVKNEELSKMIEALKVANLTVAIFPSVKAQLDFNDPTVKGTEQ